MQVVYVSGPLWSFWWPGRLANIARAALASWRHARRGYGVLCPHTNTGLYTLLPFNAERMARWLEADLALIDRLRPGDIVFMLRGWEDSAGARAEHSRAMDCPGVIITYADGREPHAAPVAHPTPDSSLIARQLEVTGARPLGPTARDDLRQALLSCVNASSRMEPPMAALIRHLVSPCCALLMAWEAMEQSPASLARTRLAAEDEGSATTTSPVS